MKKVIYIIIILLSFGAGIAFDNINDKEVIVNSTNKNNSETLSMMYEREFGSGEYIVSSSLKWPDSQSYSFNPRLSKCENGGTLSWDSTTNQVIMTGDKSDKCYVYFDIAPYHVTCSDNTLTCQIAKTYTSDGVNNLYYHDGYGDYTNSDLEAGDYSYRYSGAYEDVNNYVCFGSTESTCPDENLYRIIGLFDDDFDGVYNIKLISANFATSTILGNGSVSSDYYGVGSFNSSYPYRGTTSSFDTYYWNNEKYDAAYNATSYYNVWSYSSLNNKHLNNYYLNTYLGNTWSNKIETHTWIVGGNSLSYLMGTNSRITYNYEILNYDTSVESTYSSKVALMYVSDYYYAASPTYWSYSGYNSSDATLDYRAAIDSNWLYLGGYIELTITRVSEDEEMVFFIFPQGQMLDWPCNWAQSIRPTFYLNSNVTLTGGTGSSSDPFRLAT